VLTPAGREKLDAARHTHLAGVRRHFLDALGEPELENLCGVWEKLVPGSASASGPACG
jgi:hypothetical protein